MTAQTRLSALLRDHIAPTLRKQAFKGSGKAYHRWFDANIAVVDVQSSSWNSASEARFTINLGTASGLVRANQGFLPSTIPKEYECHWRSRIGGLIGDNRDLWWTIGARATDADLARLGGELSDLLTIYAIPELERRVSDPAIVASALDGGDVVGLSPWAMDIVGPILERDGPREVFERYIAAADQASTLEFYVHSRAFQPRMGPRRTAKALLKLESRNEWKRVEGAWELEDAPTSMDLILALRPLLGDDDSRLRTASAVALGRHGDLESISRLQAMIRTDRAQHAAVGAAISLRSMAQIMVASSLEESIRVIRERRLAEVGSARGALRELLERFDRINS